MDQVLVDLPRRRGRPKGTGTNDAPLLKGVAEECDSHPGTSAYKAIQLVVTRAYPDDEALRGLNVRRESIVRRLADKWRKDGGPYLEAVRERKRQERAKQFLRGLAGVLGGIAEFQRECAIAAERARPWLEATTTKFETALRSPEGQKALKFMATIQALQRDPKTAIWMGGVQAPRRHIGP